MFNQRIACYRIGLHLIKKLYPQYAPLIVHLRDVNTRNLPIRLIDLYRMLLKLPEHATRAELAELLPEEAAASVDQPADRSSDARPRAGRGALRPGRVRAESPGAGASARSGNLAVFGQFMRISHDGDRVVQHDAAWQPHPCVGPSSNAYLLDLMADLESGEPERVLAAAQLHMQPGACACSTPELDLIVDIALRTEGVVGAQMAGVGLGGGVMALVRDKSVDELESAVNLRYYEGPVASCRSGMHSDCRKRRC